MYVQIRKIQEESKDKVFAQMDFLQECCYRLALSTGDVSNKPINILYEHICDGSLIY